MRRLLLLLFPLVATSALAQEWTPPSRQMPEMPSTADLDGGWKRQIGAWFEGAGVSLAAIRPHGEGGRYTPRIVYFAIDSTVVETWSDRNGDGRADLIIVRLPNATEYQFIDADYDGWANVLRTYKAGALAREEKY
jgi:hypothetical protein